MTSRGDTMLGRRLGDFVIRERLGEGAVGDVFLAEQTTLGRQAVIKVLAQHKGLTSGAADRFLREARLASRLDHPFAAHVYSFGAEPDGLLWIAMELVRGMPLDRMISSQGPLPLPRFVPLFERLAEVLNAAHEQGIVHRDVKPGNVMVVNRTGRLLPKLLDLGIARLEPSKDDGPAPTAPTPAPVLAPNDTAADDVLRDASTVVITQEGAVIGTPHFMAPEQWADASKANARSDLYSLAILAYQVLTGELPFTGNTLRAVARAHAVQPMPKLPDGLPEALNAVLAKAAAKRPEDRYGDALEFAAAFRAAAAIGVETASYPQLDETVREAVLATAPQPVAEAVALIEAARTPRQAVDAVAAVQRVVTRHLAVMALAARARFGPGDATGDSDAVLDLLKRVAAGRIDDDAWRALALGLLEPFAGKRLAHPIPELVAAFFTNEGRPGMAALALNRLAALRWPAADTTVDELMAFLHQAMPVVGQVLSSVAFVFDYPLVVRKSDAERWMGTRRSRRAAQEVLGHHQPNDGEVVLLDVTGNLVLSLSPLVQLIAPSGGADEELFYLDGAGRHGARLAALPGPFERQDEALWAWFSTHLVDVTSPDALSLNEAAEPYKGLSTFTTQDADSYFGREHEAQSFANRLKAERFLAVVGPSGAGKSSFIFAGVVPLLPKAWRAVSLRPGSKPFAALAARLVAERLATPALAHEAVGDGLALAKHAAASLGPGEQLVVVVDQFEELLTLCGDPAERQAFATLLTQSADMPGSRVRVVVTLRDDFLMQTLQLEALRERLSSALMLLGTPPRGDLLRVVVEPAKRLGYSFDDEALPAKMVDAVAESPGALALLSFTAAQMWRLRDRKLRQLRAKTYDALGGVGGALARHAEDVLGGLGESEQRLVREAFRQLVTSQGTRSELSRGELTETLGDDARARAVIDRLVDARLLVTSETDGRDDRIELIHEALVTSWPRLVEWRREDSDTARLRDALRTSARQWQERGRPRGLLWRDEAVAEYRLWRARFLGQLTATELAFGEASVRDEARGRRVRRALAASALVTLTVGLLLLFRAYRTTDHALHQAEFSAHEASTRLANLRFEQGRRAMLEQKPLEALAYLSAAQKSGAQGPALTHLLKTAAWLGRGEVRRLGGLGPAFDGALSADGQRLAMVGQDGRVSVWHLTLGQLEHTVATDAFCAAFSPDGQTLSVGTRGGAVELYDVASGARRHVSDFGHGAVFRIEYRPDGEMLATSVSQGQPRLLRRTGEVVAVLTDADVSAATRFSNDGKLVAVYAGPFHTEPALVGVRLFDGESGRERGKLPLSTSPVSSVVFGTAGQVFIGFDDGRIARWAPDVGTRTWVQAVHRGAVLALALNPDASKLLSVGQDGSTRVLAPDNGATLHTFALATTRLRRAVWLDTEHFVVALPDGALEKLNARTGSHEWKFIGQTGPAFIAAPQPNRLVSFGPDGLIRLWAADTTFSSAPEGWPRGAKEVLGSPRTPIVVTTDQAWWVFDNDSKAPTPVREPVTALPTAAALSRDGRVLAVAINGEVRVFAHTPAGYERAQVLRADRPVTFVVVDEAGTTIAGQTQDDDIVLWSGRPWQQTAILRAQGVLRAPGFFSRPGSLVTVNREGAVESWGPRAEPLWRADAFHGFAAPWPSADDDTFFVVSPQGPVQIWSEARRARIASLPRLGVEPLALAVEPTGGLVHEWSSDGTWSTWDVENLRVISSVSTGSAAMSAIANRHHVRAVTTWGEVVEWPAGTPEVSAAEISRAVDCGPFVLSATEQLEARSAEALSGCEHAR